MELIILTLLAYVIGSFPSSTLVSYKWTGQNIRNFGNGNPGMMNVLDNIGVRPAIWVGILDIGKGALVVFIAKIFGLGISTEIIAALIAVIGHDYSIFLRLRGGNGMATAVGGICALAIIAAIPALIIAALLCIITGSRRLGGIIGLILVPAVAYILAMPDTIIVGIILLETIAAVKIIRFEGFSPSHSRISQ